MKTILVPTDFSENAKNALHYALEIALSTKAEILLIHISPIPYNFDSRVAEITEIMEQYSRKTLDEVISTIKKNTKYKDIKIRGTSKTDKLLTAILNVSKKENADLIVAGTKGASGMGKFFFGSNTAEIIRQAHLPVLVVPGDATYQQFRTMVYAIDYREDDLSFLHELEKFADQLGVKIETLHVAAKNSLYEQIVHRGLVQLMTDKFSDIFADHHLVINESVVDGVENYINNHPNSLLTMAHYKKPFLHRLINNSVTEEMTYHAKTPLLIFNQKF